MALDPSIFMTTRPKSAMEYLNEMAAADNQAVQSKLGQLQLLAQQGAMRDADQARQIRNRGMSAIQALGGGATNEQRINALRGVGDYGTADALEKSDLERQKTGASVQKDQAEAEKTQLANMHAKIDRHLQGLSMVTDPQSASMWLQDGVKNGVMDMQKASQQANALRTMTPEQFAQWRQSQMQGGMSIKDQIEQTWKAKDFGLRANNELIGPDGKVNQPLLNARQQVASAGKTVVSVNTGQKGFENEMKLRDDFKQEPIYKAHQEVQSAYQQIKSALGQKSPAGDLAGATKIMKLLDPNSVVRESELGMAMAASGLMDRLTNYAKMRISGEKLTPAQRADFQALADKLYSASVDQFNNKRTEYQKIGGDYGLNADRALGPEVKASKQRSVVRTGKDASGRKVVQYDDGTIDYAP